MKKIEFQLIGQYEVLKNYEGVHNNPTRISIKNEFKNALIKLNLFSHCVIFTKDENGVYCYTSKIIELNEKTGDLIIEIEGESHDIKGDLVDIKPYFPCEEVVNCYVNKDSIDHEYFTPILFKGKPVGEYLYVNNSEVIQIRETESFTANEIEKSLEQVHTGDFVRVLWWFHKFDDKKYRSHLMCNPPYENAPKSGVFATRSPVRPNPIASTVVEVKKVDKYNHNLSVLGFDGFEHSAILQIMPYRGDLAENIIVPEWLRHWTPYKVFHDDSRNNTSLNSKEDNNPFFCEDVFFKELEGEGSFEKIDHSVNEIVVEGARLHNLKDITVRIPKEKITVITGVSGSGKSSLAFDTIYHESQKQFIDLVASNSPIYSDLKDSMVGKISGLQPAIAIEQRNLGTNPRSTVASVTRIGDYLRLLFATIGERICPNCNSIIPRNNVCDDCGTIYFQLIPSIFNYNHPEYMCPVCRGLGEELQIDIDLIVSDPDASILDGASVWWGNLRKHREKPNANWMKGEVLALANDMNEDLELPFKNLSDEFKRQIFYGSDGREVTLSYENPNGRNGTITRPVEGVVNTLNRLLKDNSADGSMKYIERYIVNKKCSRCKGERLLEEGRLVRIGSTRYPEATMMNITRLKRWCHGAYNQLNDNQREKSKGIFIKLISKLKKLEQVGLSYLNLDRSIPTLSGGEAQRLKIASQFGSGISNILYIMDEPSKGLHPRDYTFLIETIKDLKKQRNTIIVVEHKKAFMDMADYWLEMGPGAGHYGGQIIRAGEVRESHSTVQDDFDYDIHEKLTASHKKIVLKGARTNNLKNIDISIPVSAFTCVIGVSGSGKSSLISKTLYSAILKEFGKNAEFTGGYDRIEGLGFISDIYYVSQKAIGKNSRSNPGTYTGVFDLIREFYSKLSIAKKMKLTKEHFSFNSKKGQCAECKGAGEIAIPMHFMPDIYVKCMKCNGKRYRDEILTVQYNGYSISDLLELEIGEVKELFKYEIKIYEILNMLDKVGLSYIKLGQSAATLSGGESQRIKLAKELCTGKTKGAIYILDEPSCGLHDEDVKKLLFIIDELTAKGATVIVIEHNPLLIRQADYLIEMGPVGGDLGGYVMRKGWGRIIKKTVHP
ncbi:TrmO family methyltransferase domain-containing protein [Candidatus Contubernalis alkaliaceticus]|uniref:TrmO family methyltransferase domain-containing protein n=1 Tax=Candidatus Contubernalis alkaliaceticus TaxID=338645 RepID=UPI001F4C07B9|nr:TrmO family methyltransferase [Candidatus Contubernalis alkalaceticus]UNC93208.1 SAM-dependent methyltransferase [Candidatus Contubernalis alkalaceticus]